MSENSLSGSRTPREQTRRTDVCQINANSCSTQHAFSSPAPATWHTDDHITRDVLGPSRIHGSSHVSSAVAHFPVGLPSCTLRPSNFPLPNFHIHDLMVLHLCLLLSVDKPRLADDFLVPPSCTAPSTPLRPFTFTLPPEVRAFGFGISSGSLS